MDYEERLKISYYKDIAVLNEEHHVYLVQHINTAQIFVKKILSVYDINVYRRIYQNPISGIPKIFELYEENGELTLIEEYIPGKTLQQVIDAGGSISQEKTAEYALKICDILKSLHSSNPPIVHRDIKPSNVMLSNEGTIYLIDLNAAKYQKSGTERDTRLLGTEGYAAPEQFGFGSSTVQTDIYSLGILMNTLLYGRLHSTENDISVLTPIINKCCKLDSKDRYKNIDQLRDALLLLNPNSKRSKSRFLPPGFRTGKWWHIAFASIFYLLYIASACLFFYVADKPSDYAVVFFLLISTLLHLLACTNYLNCWRFFPFRKSEKTGLKLLGIVIMNLALLYTEASIFAAILKVINGS